MSWNEKDYYIFDTSNNLDITVWSQTGLDYKLMSKFRFCSYSFSFFRSYFTIYLRCILQVQHRWYLRFMLTLQLLNRLMLILRFHHLTQRAFLYHQAHNFIKSVCSSHGSVLCVCIVGWSDLDDIRCNQIDTFETSNDGSQLTSRPTTSFWGSCCRSDYIDVSYYY